MEKRVFFSKGNQKRFIRDLKKETGFIWKELSKSLEINENTLSKSYFFELSSISYNDFKKMIKLIKKEERDILEYYGGKTDDQIIVIGRKVIGEQRKILGGINIAFKKTNLNLDNSNVNYSLFDKKKNIKLPNKITPELAEEIGMHYGDGFLSAKRFTYRLKGNLKDEIPYYQNYIKPLFKKLYNLDVNLKQYQTTYGFEIYSQALCEFKINVLGIKPGNKEYISFPEVLKVNNIPILAAFIRGLFDTDGCLYFKTGYNIKKYYPVIKLELFSKKVIFEVGNILKMLGFDPKIYFKNNTGRIFLNGIGSLKKWEKLVGWSSQKNLNKLNDWKKRYPQLNIMANVA